MKSVFPKKPEKMYPAVFLEVYSSFTRPEYGAVVVRSIKRKVSESSERLFSKSTVCSQTSFTFEKLHCTAYGSFVGLSFRYWNWCREIFSNLFASAQNRKLNVENASNDWQKDQQTTKSSNLNKNIFIFCWSFAIRSENCKNEGAYPRIPKRKFCKTTNF
jgi:hypothetical protein